MTPYTRVLTLGACAAFLAGGTVGQAQRRSEPSGPDAFLAFQVESTDELVAVLNTNSRLRQLYARHFGVSEAEVVDFVKRSLVPYRLPAARQVLTYGVTKTGRIYSVRTRLARGTRVWANRSGVPILKWLCANPLIGRLPPKPPPPRVIARRPTPRIRPVVARVTTPTTTVPPVALTPPLVTPGYTPPPEIIIPPPGGGGFPVGGLVAAAFLPFAFGGSGGETPPTPPPPPPPVIPEPGTLALLAGGVPFGLVTLRRALKRRNQSGSRQDG